MKKLLGIAIFTLLFISIDLIKSNEAEACHYGWMIPKSSHSTFELLKCKAESAIDDINPVNYFKNKKKCQEWADNADTVARGKTRYKDCMDDPSDYWNEKNFSNYNLRNVVL